LPSTPLFQLLLPLLLVLVLVFVMVLLLLLLLSLTAESVSSSLLESNRKATAASNPERLTCGTVMRAGERDAAEGDVVGEQTDVEEAAAGNAREVRLTWRVGPAGDADAGVGILRKVGDEDGDDGTERRGPLGDVFGNGNIGVGWRTRAVEDVVVAAVTPGDTGCLAAVNVCTAPPARLDLVAGGAVFTFLPVLEEVCEMDGADDTEGTNARGVEDACTCTENGTASASTSGAYRSGGNRGDAEDAAIEAVSAAAAEVVDDESAVCALGNNRMCSTDEFIGGRNGTVTDGKSGTAPSRLAERRRGGDGDGEVGGEFHIGEAGARRGRSRTGSDIKRAGGSTSGASTFAGGNDRGGGNGWACDGVKHTLI
jgi:hypothetical protein